MSSQDGAYGIMIKTKYLCKFNYLDAYSLNIIHAQNNVHFFIMLYAVGAYICCKAYSKQIPIQDMSSSG